MFEVFQPVRIFSSFSGQELVAFVDRCLERGRTTIVIDFVTVTFMDSAGLGALVLALKHVRTQSGRLILCSLNGQAQMLLELTSLETAFEIYPDLDGVKQALDLAEAGNC